MSKSVENYVDRYIKSYHKKIQQICEPLQRCFGINYFTYHSVTPEGYWRPIVSRMDWADFFTENQLYLHDPFLLHPRCYQNGAILWASYVQEPYCQQVLKVAEDQFLMAHGFCIIERQGENCEFFGFSAPPEQENIYATYLNDLPLLKEFCRHFKTELAALMKKTDEDPIPLLPLKGEIFQAYDSPFERPLEKSLFLKEIRAKSSIQLSKREKECLSAYLDDFRMQDVAYKLGLSVRTVEFYLTNIKNKLDCSDKAELLKKGYELRTRGLLP